MSISLVGSVVFNNASGLVSQSVTPSATGDIAICCFQGANITSTSATISGGGVTTWTLASSYYDTTGGALTLVSTWWGVITTAGSTTVSIGGTFNGYNTIFYAEFNESVSSYTWSQIAVSPAAGSSGASIGTATTATCPTLTASGAVDYLYWGQLCSLYHAMTSSATSGFTYGGWFSDLSMFAYDTAYTTGAGGPGWTQTTSGNWDTSAILLGTGSSGSSSPASFSLLPNRPVTVISNAGWRGAGHSR